MNRRSLSITGPTLLCLATVFLLSTTLFAAQLPGATPDVILKIGQLEETLNQVDNLLGTGSGNPQQSPTMMLRGMLQGTSWIDPSRLIVVGVEGKKPQAAIAALIPFQTPNDNFQAAYRALSGPDYYLIPLPPNQPLTISEQTHVALVQAASSDPKAGIRVEIALKSLLDKAEDQIKAKLDQLERLPQPGNQGKPSLSPGDTRDMLSNMLTAATQIETLLFGLTLEKGEMRTVFEANALKGSRLSKLFTRKGKTTLLDTYKPGYQVNFRSLAYNIEGFVNLVGALFGELYKKLGIDFSKFTAIAKHFSGEMAGGISYGKEGVKYEMILVTKKTAKQADFLEKVYLPWMASYAGTMKALMEQQFGEDLGQIYSRTPDTTVAGHKVVGERLQIPFIPGAMGVPGQQDMSQLMSYEVRMAQVGDLILAAPDDRRMGEMIRITKRLSKKPARGHLLEADVDLSAYLKGIVEMMPEFQGEDFSLPRMGKLTLMADAENGKARATSSLKLDDLGGAVAYYKAMKSGEEYRPPRSGAGSMTPSEREEAPEKMPVKEKIVMIPPEEDPVYWTNNGVSASTYGADKAAIPYFKKALELDPEKSEAYFNMGISFGEIGKFDKAIEALDRAVEMKPEKGLYYYGRGRVYLLSGNRNRAIEDFKSAAQLGNTNARSYLINKAGIRWD